MDAKTQIDNIKQQVKSLKERCERLQKLVENSNPVFCSDTLDIYTWFGKERMLVSEKTIQQMAKKYGGTNKVRKLTVKDRDKLFNPF